MRVRILDIPHRQNGWGNQPKTSGWRNVNRANNNAVEILRRIIQLEKAQNGENVSSDNTPFKIPIDKYTIPNPYTTYPQDNVVSAPIRNWRSFVHKEENKEQNNKRTFDKIDDEKFTIPQADIERLQNITPYLSELSDAQQNAILSNIYSESNGKYNKKGLNNAYGLFQFDPDGELPKYKKWLSDNGYKDSEENQIKYFLNEMLLNEKYDARTPYDRNSQKNVGKWINPTYLDYSTEKAVSDWLSDNPYNTSHSFVARYLRPGKPRMTDRIELMKEIGFRLFPNTEYSLDSTYNYDWLN